MFKLHARLPGMSSVQVMCIDGKHRVMGIRGDAELMRRIVKGWFRWYRSDLLKDTAALVRTGSKARNSCLLVLVRAV